MGEIALSRAARADLIQHFVFLFEEAGEPVADRFLQRAQEGFQLLAEQPLVGPAVPLQLPALAGVRKWRVRDFDRFLVFYMPIEDGIRVIRVLHSSQDWWSLLGLVGIDTAQFKT